MHLNCLGPVSSTECFLFFSILKSPQNTLLEGEGSGYHGWWLDVMQRWLFIGIEAAFFIHRIAVLSHSVISNCLWLHELYVAQQAPLAMGILQARILEWCWWILYRLSYQGSPSTGLWTILFRSWAIKRGGVRSHLERSRKRLFFIWVHLQTEARKSINRGKLKLQAT